MTDRELRTLARLHLESPADTLLHARLLNAQVRARLLPESRLRLAAALGHSASRLARPDTPPLPTPIPRDTLEHAILPIIPIQHVIPLTIRTAQLALPIFQALPYVNPSDPPGLRFSLARILFDPPPWPEILYTACRLQELAPRHLPPDQSCPASLCLAYALLAAHYSSIPLSFSHYAALSLHHAHSLSLPLPNFLSFFFPETRDT